jgi:hypothetical protein
MLVLVSVSRNRNTCSWETNESSSNVLSASIRSEILRRLSLQIQILVRSADSDRVEGQHSLSKGGGIVGTSTEVRISSRR